MNKTYALDWKKYSSLARAAVNEGCVLLRNENQALPLCSGETVAVFGRIQLDYYKSGTGSGGMVNVPYVYSVLDGLAAYSDIHIYQPLLDLYRSWTKEHPFDKGSGWGTDPWCQVEMELDEAVVSDAAAHSDAAIIILGRTAGEDRDNSADEGSYTLTALENDMLKKVCRTFNRTIVLLNVGNIIDMSWVEKYQPSSVLYIWQGGMEGGLGTADILCGKVSPSGKLSDTIASSLSDYPSVKNFGSPVTNVYEEDIYVGYRYFETFAKEKVLYPFGFGLSYTNFSVDSEAAIIRNKILVRATVTNIGSCSGKEVVQVYCCPPQGKLGKPVRNLCGYGKTDLLAPGESQTLTIPIEKSTLASYDDGGVTGHKSCYVLEAGSYELYVGTDVRSAALSCTFTVTETIVTAECKELLAPRADFTRIRPVLTEGHTYQVAMEQVPKRSSTPEEHCSEETLTALPYTGNQGFKLADVLSHTVSMDQFLAQLSDQDLIHMVRGEGMCSPKVTPGTASAFGGLTENLKAFGIPAGCCSDGPSGIRMDCGASAFSLPNGTLLACTFNEALTTALYEMEGLELYANHIDSLLGPGINIHRCPLNGRNFEYCSEDPYLTGTIAAAQLKGMSVYNISGTIKHFCANNQEFGRHSSESIVSERALREIYLKPFEICARSGHTRSVMTTYGAVNGLWTAGNHDLVTGLLRNEWGFDGIVMTDWWAKANQEDQPASVKNRAEMVRAQNDLFMVTEDATINDDNLCSSLENGTLTRAQLIRCASNICSFLMQSPAMQQMNDCYCPVEHINQPATLAPLEDSDHQYYELTEDTTIDLSDRETDGGTMLRIPVSFPKPGNYHVEITASTDAPDLAQLSVTLGIDGISLKTFSFHGGSSEPVATELDKPLRVRSLTHYMKLYFSISGLKIQTLRIYLGDEPTDFLNR